MNDFEKVLFILVFRKYHVLDWLENTKQYKIACFIGNNYFACYDDSSGKEYFFYPSFNNLKFYRRSSCMAFYIDKEIMGYLCKFKKRKLLMFLLARISKYGRDIFYNRCYCYLKYINLEFGLLDIYQFLERNYDVTFQFGKPEFPKLLNLN